MQPGNMKYEDWMNKNAGDFEELEANQYVPLGGRFQADRFSGFIQCQSCYRGFVSRV